MTGQTHVDLENPQYIKWTQFLKESDRWSLDQISDYQFSELKRVITAAYENTQGYRNLFDKNHISPYKINAVNGISIHIRRGDLLSRPIAVKDQPYSSDEYYYEGIEIIKERDSNPELFIFSDDIEWVENNVNFDLPTTYINSKGPDHEHFYLMSRCKHNIITNSTFSWWAAWLNKYENKIVISPKWWYRDPEINSKIIWIPKNWITLNNIKNG